jgi:hypothetical protein
VVVREHGMWEIQEVLRHLGRGESQVVVAAATGRGRKTIRRYQRLAQQMGWKAGPGEPEEAVVLRILEQVRPGPKAPEPGPREGLLIPRHAQIQAWLSGTPEGGTANGARGLTLTKVRRLLQRRESRSPTVRSTASRSSTASSARPLSRFVARRPGQGKLLRSISTGSAQFKNGVFAHGNSLPQIHGVVRHHLPPFLP